MRAEADHIDSVLLTRDESEQVYRLLGNRCQVSNSLCSRCLGLLRWFVVNEHKGKLLQIYSNK